VRPDTARGIDTRYVITEVRGGDCSSLILCVPRCRGMP